MSTSATEAEQPCKCHRSFASVTSRHPGHCCFFPKWKTCHPAEVAEWERQRDEREKASADARTT